MINFYLFIYLFIYNMSKPKILIIGGGIGGLSCATSLAETGQFDISIYESDILGGQASSKKSKLCNTEIAWRMMGGSYNNFLRILKDIDAFKNIYPGYDEHICTEKGVFSPNSVKSLLSVTFKSCNYEEINKMLVLFFLSKQRAINSYHNISGGEFFKCDTMDMILGPYVGLEPKKVTVSAYYKYLFGLFSKQYYGSGTTQVTKYPTSDSIFNPWKQYLLKKG